MNKPRDYDAYPIYNKGLRSDPEPRFWSKVMPTGFCWEWTASKMSGGYGSFTPSPHRPMPAHRFAYETLIGPIPDGYSIDHLCRNRGCVNPDHLEPVPPGVNTLRGFGPSARKRRQTHCDRGHEFSGENLQIASDGSRLCRTCRKNNIQKQNARRITKREEIKNGRHEA